MIKWLPLTFQSELHIRLETAENQAQIGVDICNLIDTTLIEQLTGEDPDLQIRDPALILEIRDVLTQKAQGMYVLSLKSNTTSLLIIVGFCG